MTTIYAVSSGRPPAAIAVVRISGPAACTAAETLAGRLPAPRHASLAGLRDADGALLDRALVIVFPGPRTATGEDLVEFHCHGGRAVIAAVERALSLVPGLRPAEPGEFTRRALTNGRIDLTEAEGLADLLEAETEGQRIAAINAAEGRVSQAVRGWMDDVAMLSARIERALLDRASSYLGVMIDDLVLQGVTEPYRMLTARAEFRLSLRADNAETRLGGIALAAGCLGAERRAHQHRRSRGCRSCSAPSSGSASASIRDCRSWGSR